MTRPTRRDPEVRQVRVFRLIQARPHTLFGLLTDPRRHAQLDGSGMLRGNPVGPDRLQLGDIFTMAMSQGHKVYRSTNEVVEFEPDRRIAWRSTGSWRGHIPVGGQRWRYILYSDPAGTLVEHAYVWGYARMPLLTVWLPGFCPPDAAGHEAQPWTTSLCSLTACSGISPTLLLLEGIDDRLRYFKRVDARAFLRVRAVRTHFSTRRLECMPSA
jgi:uncharacterized protein YndB with AHSA1/START domain